MKILVAGGAGYIGSRLVPELVAEGHDVTVVDHLWFGNYLPNAVPLIEKDIFDLRAEDVKGYDQVIFLAGLSNDPMAEFSPSLNFVQNAAAPAFLATISKAAGVKRFIYAGSCSVYGYSADEQSTEDSPAKSTYPYGISKLQGEYGALQLADENFSVICLRQGTVSGYSPRMRFDLLVNTMYMKALTEGKITVSNPAIRRPLLTISDAVQAYQKSIDAPAGVSGIFNAVSGNYTIGDVASIVHDFVKERFGVEVEVVLNEVKDFRNYHASNKKAEDVLGVAFDGSVESVLNELAERFDPTFDFTHKRHYNIQMFKELFGPGGTHGHPKH